MHDNETFNGRATGTITGVNSGKASPAKQYDEMAQTFKEPGSPVPVAGAVGNKVEES